MTLTDLLPLPQQLMVRIGAAAAGCAVVAGALSLIWLSGRAHGVAAEAPRVAAAQAAQRTLAAQTVVSAAGAEASDRAAARTARIVQLTEEADRAVQAEPAAAAPLDPALLARWRAGLDGLRREAAAPLAPDRDGEPDAARALRPPGG
jgi:hypothetical protein